MNMLAWQAAVFSWSFLALSRGSNIIRGLKFIICCVYKELHSVSSTHCLWHYCIPMLTNSVAWCYEYCFILKGALVEVHMAIYHYHRPQPSQPAHSSVAASKKALLPNVGTKGRPHSEADLYVHGFMINIISLTSHSNSCMCIIRTHNPVVFSFV